MFDFFVSHSSTDKSSIVNELVTVLQNMGYTVWYDKNEILAGDGILSSVKYGLSNSYCLILVITDNFAKSKWTFYETGTFDAQNNRIIPLIYDVSETEKNTITGMLGNRKYLDMNKITKEEADGKKRMGYKIAGQEFAVYHYYDVQLPADAPQKLSSVLNITDEVLRAMIVRADARKAKYEARRKEHNPEEPESEDARYRDSPGYHRRGYRLHGNFLSDVNEPVL